MMRLDFGQIPKKRQVWSLGNEIPMSCVGLRIYFGL